MGAPLPANRILWAQDTQTRCPVGGLLGEEREQRRERLERCFRAAQGLGLGLSLERSRADSTLTVPLCFVSAQKWGPGETKDTVAGWPLSSKQEGGSFSEGCPQAQRLACP